MTHSPRVLPVNQHFVMRNPLTWHLKKLASILVTASLEFFIKQFVSCVSLRRPKILIVELVEEKLLLGRIKG